MFHELSLGGGVNWGRFFLTGTGRNTEIGGLLSRGISTDILGLGFGIFLRILLTWLKYDIFISGFLSGVCRVRSCRQVSCVPLELKEGTGEGKNGSAIAIPVDYKRCGAWKNGGLVGCSHSLLARGGPGGISLRLL